MKTSIEIDDALEAVLKVIKGVKKLTQYRL